MAEQNTYLPVLIRRQWSAFILFVVVNDAHTMSATVGLLCRVRPVYGVPMANSWSPAGYTPHAPLNRKALSGAARLAVGALATSAREVSQR